MTSITGRFIAAAVVVLVLAQAPVVLANLYYLPVLGDSDPGIHNAASVPNTLHICGRSYGKSSLARNFTYAELEAMVDMAPAVVDTGFFNGYFAPCRPGVCSAAARETPCQTVIYVRIGPDAYVSYSVRGGP